MNTGRIERLFSAVDAQKTCTLFKGFGSEFRYFFECRTTGKLSVFFSVGHDVFGNRFINAGDVLQESSAGCIKVDAHFIHTVFHDTGQCFGELFLVAIMLVLTDTDGLRIDFDEFRKRIL